MRAPHYEKARRAGSAAEIERVEEEILPVPVFLKNGLAGVDDREL